jgi:outer membrane receptor protein involved in Fe transport
MKAAAWLLALLLPAGSAAAEGPAALGAIRGIVFSGERPLAGARIAVEGGASAESDADGVFGLQLPAGVHQLSLEAAGRGREALGAVPVTAGGVSELLVLVPLEGGPVRVTLEAPAAILGEQPVEPTTEAPAAKGLVRGRARHAGHGGPICGARVFARGQEAEARTDADGRFALPLPPGRHALTLVHPEYSTQALPELELQAGEERALEVLMAPAAVELDALVVAAPRVEGAVHALMEERRQSLAVSEVIGAEQMARAGDSDAAGALKRVTGVTVVGGRYVYVRGLGERYSSTLLNGSSLPSPEPERRVVPLDLFPTDLLDSVVIQKTYSADLPGEFGGGAILLRTRTFPEGFHGHVALSSGVRLGTTFEPGQRYPGGMLDFLGIDDGTRALPAGVKEASDRAPLLERDMFSDRGYTAAELERFGESMQRVYSTREETTLPPLGLDASLGLGGVLLGRPAGLLFTLGWEQDWQKTDRELTVFTVGAGGALEPAHRYRFDQLERAITLSGSLALGMDLAPGHALRLTSLLVRLTDDEARVYQGENRDVGTDIRVTGLHWQERMLFAQQVHGQHAFPAAVDLSLDWRYNFALATRHEPDWREQRYDRKSSGLWLLSDRPEGNQRQYSDLMDMNHDLGIDLGLPFRQWSGLEARARLGLQGMFKERGVDTRRYKFQHKGPRAGDPALLRLPGEEIFAPENIGPDGFQFEEITRQTDNYTAQQRVVAAYASLELPIVEGLTATLGLRLEHGLQRVETFELFNPDQRPVVAALEDLDLLPAIGLGWRFHPAHQLRAAYGRTLSRPDFRELSPATFNDVTGGRQMFGNPELERAVIHHADVRWEWDLGEGESLSLAAFYKRFEAPIETIVVVSAQHSVTFANAAGAHNAGAELEYTQKLGFLHRALADFFLAGNLTYVFSRIELPPEGIQTSRSRPLQGQSPFVVNLQAGYHNPDWGTRVTLLYHVFGARIHEVGALGAPDVVEQPFHQLDLVASQELGAGFKLGVKARNLIDLPHRLTQGPETVERHRTGRVLSLSLTWSF